MTETSSIKNTPKRIILYSFVIAFIALVIFFITTGGGHGTYFFAKILYPYLMISTAYYGTMTDEFIVTIFLQYPLYGFLLAYACHKNYYNIMLYVLVSLHIIAVLFAIIITAQSSNF